MKEMVLPLHLPYTAGAGSGGPADLILPAAFANSSPMPQLPPGAFMAPPDYDTATKSGVAGAPPDYEAACRAASVELKDQETQPLTHPQVLSPPTPTPQSQHSMQQAALSVDAVMVTHHQPQDHTSDIPPPRMV